MAYEDAIRGEMRYLLQFLEECGLREEERVKVVEEHLIPIYVLTLKMVAADMEGAIQRRMAE